MGDDEDPVGVELRDLVADRQQRVGVADLALGLDARGAQLLQGLLEALLRRHPGVVDVAHVVVERLLDEGGRDHEHLGGVAAQLLDQAVADLVAPQRLIGDDKALALGLGGVALHCASLTRVRRDTTTRWWERLLGHYAGQRRA